MKQTLHSIKPQDIVILLKIADEDNPLWQQKALAEMLKISQSEVSQSVARSKYAGLLDSTGKRVMRLALMDFLEYGLAYVFPQKPGPLVRGIPTAHSAAPLNSVITSNEPYVWPYAKGNVKGQEVLPLYPTAPEAALHDSRLYELLALADALRVGKTREKGFAVKELKKRLRYGE